MRYTYKYDEYNGILHIEEADGNEEYPEDTINIYLCVNVFEKNFLARLINYANFGAEIEASSEEELDMSDIDNFTE